MHRFTRLFTSLGIYVLLAVAVLSACGSTEPPPLVSIESACAIENDGKPASVVGYFQTDFMVFCTDSCTVGFAETPDGDSPLSPDVAVGTGRNQMRELPDNFQPSDFKVTAQDGTTLGLNDHVQLSGKMSVGENVCLMYVEQIRAAPDAKGG